MNDENLRSVGYCVGAACRSPLLLLFALAILLTTGCTVDEGTPPPRPTIVVITSVGPYATTFDDPGDWLVGVGPKSSGRVEAGRYILTITESNTVVWANQSRSFGDAIYEVEATLEKGAEASGFGLLLLGSTDMRSFIYTMITGDGRYDVGYCEGGCETQESMIGGWTLAPIILPDGQTNYLRIELRAGQLTFSVNGASVSQINGLEYTQGVLGVIGESSSFGGMEAAFDNLQVTE